MFCGTKLFKKLGYIHYHLITGKIRMAYLYLSFQWGKAG